jgi:2-hydroxy-6-oxonona-2,4-dienedioate hydrolase
MSGGVPPSLQLAARHPERVEGLVLISLAPYAPLTADDQELPVPLWLYDALFASDFPLWAVSRVAPGRLAPLFDARDELLAQTTPEEARFLDAMIHSFMPVTLRRRGLGNEGAAIDPAAALDPARLTMPALVIHARDDRITPYATAEFTALRIAGAELLTIDAGGHLLLGRHDLVRERVADFLKDLVSGGVAAPADHPR